MHTLGNTQGLLSQRKRQCFSAGPNQETNSMGSHGGQSETKTVMKAWANASPKMNAVLKTSKEPVGAGLPAIAVCLCRRCKLTQRYRWQASSHRESGPASGLRSMHYRGAQRQP
jgi:hypothetical protein